jgi:hypothetical protein
MMGERSVRYPLSRMDGRRDTQAVLTSLSSRIEALEHSMEQCLLITSAVSTKLDAVLDRVKKLEKKKPVASTPTTAAPAKLPSTAKLKQELGINTVTQQVADLKELVQGITEEQPHSADLTPLVHSSVSAHRPLAKRRRGPAPIQRRARFAPSGPSEEEYEEADNDGYDDYGLSFDGYATPRAPRAAVGYPMTYFASSAPGYMSHTYPASAPPLPRSARAPLVPVHPFSVPRGATRY